MMRDSIIIVLIIASFVLGPLMIWVGARLTVWFQRQGVAPSEALTNAAFSLAHIWTAAVFLGLAALVYFL